MSTKNENVFTFLKICCITCLWTWKGHIKLLLKRDDVGSHFGGGLFHIYNLFTFIVYSRTILYGGFVWLLALRNLNITGEIFLIGIILILIFWLKMK